MEDLAQKYAEEGHEVPLTYERTKILMRRLLRSINERFIRADGTIHAAGFRRLLHSFAFNFFAELELLDERMKRLEDWYDEQA